ncbi:uncharacterized protein LOC107047695 [Diachasma alloeum]|uniref:uncharacterized protein LOC107047695 n=1 Tax=Diachasma alloeum TaxID=454923 RepID=UPI0007383541|nr:uncharacterized protein LOC107047695 [Diachasma alloeum]
MPILRRMLTIKLSSGICFLATNRVSRVGNTLGKEVDAMYQLHATLLPLVLTIFPVLSVEVADVSGPTREQIKGALQTVGKFLKDDAGSSWLASVSHNQDDALTTEELMREIINSTGSDGVREAAGLISLALELQKSVGKANESLTVKPEELKEFVETIADRDDVMCLYRTKSEVPTRRVEDWKKTVKSEGLNGYSAYVALDTGIQEVLCLKKNSLAIPSTDEAITVNRPPETSSILPEELPKPPPITPGNETMNVPDEVDVNNPLVNEDEGTVGKSPNEECGSDSNPCTSPISSNSSASDLESVEALPALEAPNVEEEMPMEVKMRSMSGGSDGSVSDKMKGENPCSHQDDDVRNFVKNRSSKDASSENRSYESGNYALHICPFHKICREVKAHERQYGLMNIPSHSPLNNEPLERLLNPQAQHSRFSRNGNGFVKNLYDNGILTHQGYSKHMNTYFILRNRNSEEVDGDSNPFDSGDHQNSVSSRQPVRPSSEFVAGQLRRGGYPWILLDPQSVLARSFSDLDFRQIDTSGNQENDNSGGEGKGKMLSIKVFVNNPSKEPVKLSIYTHLDPEIELYHNKEEVGDNEMSQFKLKMFKQHRDSAQEKREDKLITEVDKQDYKHTFDALMDLLTSGD